MIKVGLTKKEFLENFYEKDIFFKRNAYTVCFSWAEIDKTLFGWDPNDGTLRLFKNEVVSPEKYMEQVLDVGLRRTRIRKDALYDEMRDGATLVLDRIDLKNEYISNLTNEIGKFIGEKAVSNGYAAFGGTGTFGKHWDTHDVFAIQLIGSKRWKIYPPTMLLPLADQKSKFHKNECSEDPIFDECLNAGDILYIPRGWWHEAIPIVDTETFHVAVGIHVPRLNDYLVWVCVNKMANFLSSRASIKFESSKLEGISELVEILKTQLESGSNLNEYKCQILDNARVETEFKLELGNPSFKSQTDFGRIKINSMYKSTLDDKNDNIINGIKLNLDLKSADRINSILQAQADPVDEKDKELIRGLIRNDVLSN